MNIKWKKCLILAGMATLSLGVYVFYSIRIIGPGYPLDDAWIHQTFSRNLAHFHELSYFEGIPSTGSTSPFWTLLLSLGYYFSENNYIWTMLLGLGALFVLGWLGEIAFSRICPEYQSIFPWAGVILIGEWHFVWAAGSGMETLVLADIILAVFFLLLEKKDCWFWIGALIGIGIWVRPEALTLLGPAALILGIGMVQQKNVVKQISLMILGLIICLIPYLYLNYSVSGNLWPNTFFAKQAEYHSLLNRPFWIRFGDVFRQHIVGIGILLLPGFFYKTWKSIQERNWVILAFIIWWFGFLLIYASRLPVPYQHGRYEIPIMPVFFLIAGAGVFKLFLVGNQNKWGRVLVYSWLLSIILVWVGFFGIGANAYANDVAIIETEMVVSAKWIDRNTPTDSIIAAHDIGALGYYGNRKIIDLAGLISPEVVPIIRDEQELWSFIREKKANYLMTFPNWYPVITNSLEKVFTTSGDFSPASGGENMSVYIIYDKK